MNTSEMTPEQLRLEIARVKGIPIAYARTHSFKTGYSQEYLVNAVTSKKIPDWPASIEAAWELVEEMKHGYIWTLYQMWSGNEASSWSATIEKLSHHKIERVVEIKCAETAPIAICRAYLEWKAGVEISPT